MLYNLDCYLLFLYMMSLDIVGYPAKYLRFEHGGYFLLSSPSLDWRQYSPSLFFFFWDNKIHPQNTLICTYNCYFESWHNSDMPCLEFQFVAGAWYAGLLSVSHIFLSTTYHCLFDVIWYNSAMPRAWLWLVVLDLRW